MGKAPNEAHKHLISLDFHSLVADGGQKVPNGVVFLAFRVSQNTSIVTLFVALKTKVSFMRRKECRKSAGRLFFCKFREQI